MSAPVIGEARAAQLAAENPHLQCRRSIVNRHYSELAIEALSDDFPWCSSHPTILSELGRIAEHGAEQARLVAAGLEANPPSTARTAALRVRQARNGTPEPQRNQLAAELVEQAFRFQDRFPATDSAEIIQAFAHAHRTLAKLHRDGQL